MTSKPVPRGDRKVHKQEGAPPRSDGLDVEWRRLKLPAPYTSARGPRRDQVCRAAPWPPPGSPATPGPPPPETKHRSPGPRGTARAPREHTMKRAKATPRVALSGRRTLCPQTGSPTNFSYFFRIATNVRRHEKVRRLSILDSRQALSDSRQAFLDSRQACLARRRTFYVTQRSSKIFLIFLGLATTFNRFKMFVGTPHRERRCE